MKKFAVKFRQTLDFDDQINSGYFSEKPDPSFTIPVRQKEN